MDKRRYLNIFSFILLFVPSLAFARVSKSIPLVRQLSTYLKYELLDLLNQKNCPSEVRGKVAKAIHLFHDTKGFGKTIELLFREKDTVYGKGFLYEIEKALELHEKHFTKAKEPVIQAFSPKIKSPRSGRSREFDLLACIEDEPVLYECKNIGWNCVSTRILSQLLDQQRIARELEMPYIVSSKRPVPDIWRAWFKEKHITLEQPLN